MATSISPSEIERLAKRITDLDRQSQYLRVWLYGWTALVAVGLILEYRKDFLRLVQLLWVYTIGPVPFEWWRVRLAFATIFAGVLVTVGVIGELGIEFQQSGVETQLEATNGTLTGDLGQVAKEAADNAKDALRDASTAMTQVGTVEPKLREAQEASQRALETSSRAQVIASNAESHLREAEKDASEAERKAATVLDRFADRVLTDEQAERIAAKARSFSGQEFDITPYRDVPESLHIAERILGILTSVSVGWKYTPPSSATFLMGGVSGVLIDRHPDADERTKLAAETLIAVLNKEGIRAELRIENPTNNPKHNTIHISVGTKW
jgi:hypothetical protein